MSPSERFWRAWYAPKYLLPIACLAFGQAAFEAFLLDTLVFLSATWQEKRLPPRMGLQRILKEYQDRFSVQVDPADKMRLDEFAATRNLWIHNGGVVTTEYAAKAPARLEPGTLREVHSAYVEYALWSYDDAARQLVRALFGPKAV